MIRVEAHAKINLVLDITGKRPDGYHEVRMILQELSLHDHVDLEVLSDPWVRLAVSGGDPGVPVDTTNLAVRAANLMRETFGIREGVSIRLTKKIPSAAGLGGGSSDAAAVIRGMNVLFGLRLSAEEMMKLGEKLGADVPFCILGGTALAEGFGEKLTALAPLPSVPVLLLRPKETVITAETYAAFDGRTDAAHPDVDACRRAIEAWSAAPEGNRVAGDAACLENLAAHMGNMLEPVTKEKLPVIGEIEALLREAGASAVMMSGSGPAVFALFAGPEACAAAAAKAAAAFAELPEAKIPEIIETFVKF